MILGLIQADAGFRGYSSKSVNSTPFDMQDMDGRDFDFWGQFPMLHETCRMKFGVTRRQTSIKRPTT